VKNSFARLHLRAREWKRFGARDRAAGDSREGKRQRGEQGRTIPDRRPPRTPGLELGVAYWLMVQPPLGDNTWPVMNFASSLAR
jgi:hypothetical protein